MTLAWNVTGETAAPAPVALIERQLQLWTTPHGVIKAAMANNATVQGRTVAFAVPGRYSIKATLDDRGMVERVEAVLSNPVVGDMPVEVTYADYRDFGGVKFPMRIRQAAGGFPARGPDGERREAQCRRSRSRCRTASARRPCPTRGSAASRSPTACGT